MSNVLLAGCGSIGSHVAELVAESHPDAALTVADVDSDRAAELAGRIGARSVVLDVTDPASVAAAIEGSDIVFNAIGPFYRHGLRMVRATIEAGADYVDVCDDADVTLDALQDDDLRKRIDEDGRTALLGIGGTPGLSNLLGQLAISHLDDVHEIHFAVAVPRVADLSAAIDEHLDHSFAQSIQYLDGSFQRTGDDLGLRRFELRRPFSSDIDFRFWGHPEAVTMPFAHPDLRQATARFAWLDPEGSDPAGSLSHAEAIGALDGRPTTARVEVHSLFHNGKRRGPMLTAVPAARALGLMIDGALDGRGIGGPEAMIDPKPFLDAAYGRLGLEILETGPTPTEP